jgi:YVTN family beta-propeller protein
MVDSPFQPERPGGRVICHCVIGLVALALVGQLLRAPSTRAIGVVATVGVYCGPFGVAVAATRNLIYVANRLSSSVSIVDGATSQVIGGVGVGYSPDGLAVNETTNTIYVAYAADNIVSVIDGATDTVIATITTGTNAAGLAVNETTNTVYVANIGINRNTISVIDGATNTIKSTITVGSVPANVAFDQRSNFALCFERWQQYDLGGRRDAE